MILEFARAHFWPLFWTGCAILAAVIGFTIWYVLTEPAHDLDDDADLEWERVKAIPASHWQDMADAYDEWEQLDPDQAADTLIAEWHDEPQERTVTRDVWDEWWAGMDGLDRECLTVRRWFEHEERLWAELKAETNELCPLDSE